MNGNTLNQLLQAKKYLSERLLRGSNTEEIAGELMPMVDQLDDLILQHIKRLILVAGDND